MKTKVASLLVVFSFITTFCMAQEKITVEAQNNDISNNLDLKAVATAFGESKNLEEFEQKLNDYDSQISNLDLNNDGQVDYLRVIEKNEEGIHLVEIQAVLDKDVYQDVASIIVEKDENDNPTVQVIGDPYIYGDNYVIEPSYLYTPSIFSFFWGANYYSWNSPYYWGYYPSYYHHRRTCGINEYYSNVYGHINHNQRYYYTNGIRNASAARYINSNRRNDLGIRHPDRSFSSRNANVRNKRDFEFNRGAGNSQTRSSYQGSGSRPVRSFDNSGSRNQGFQNSTRTYNPNNSVRTNVESRNSSPRSYSTPNSVQQNNNVNRDPNRNYQTRQTYTVPNRSTSVDTRNESRQQNNVSRDNNSYRQQNVQRDNNTYRSTPSVSQPRQENVQRQQVERSSNSNSNVSRPAPAPRVESNSPRVEQKRESRSNSDSNRR
ncbi:MAG: hypothetical protein PHT07_06380 [Paludibacter sp.]|nr:hypothetical protein [Paludibacter sp.]